MLKDENESILALFNFFCESVEITLPDEDNEHLIDIITHAKISSQKCIIRTVPNSMVEKSQRKLWTNLT